MDSLEMKIFIKSTYMDQAMKSLEYFIGKCFPNIKVKSQSSYLRKREFNRKRFERREPEHETYKKRPKKYNDFDDDYENVRIKDQKSHSENEFSKKKQKKFTYDDETYKILSQEQSNGDGGTYKTSSEKNDSIPKIFECMSANCDTNSENCQQTPRKSHKKREKKSIQKENELKSRSSSQERAAENSQKYSDAWDEMMLN